MNEQKKDKKIKPKLKINPIDEVVNVILKSQAKSCVRAKKMLENRSSKDLKNS